jgi:threonine synthase
MRTGILQRYGDFLPVTPKTPNLSLCEGSTPLVRLLRVGEEAGVEVYAKVEGANPTGSFKDRGMVLAVAKALEDGAKGIVCASTGNTSASAAAYAAAAGIRCTVLLPKGKVALGKLSQALAFGARAVCVEGNFDIALQFARKAADELGITLVNSVNPYRLWGQRSSSWEICDDLSDAPDWLMIPVGNAGNISAYCAGFEFYKETGRSTRLPRLIGVQAEGAAPMVRGVPVIQPETLATAIRIGNPVSADKAKRAVELTNGMFLSVSDREILDAQRLLASTEGIFAEPASCATLAAFLRLARNRKIQRGTKGVLVLTGNGLKDPEAPMHYLPEPVSVAGSWEAILEVLSR